MNYFHEMHQDNLLSLDLNKIIGNTFYIDMVHPIKKSFVSKTLCTI